MADVQESLATIDELSEALGLPAIRQSQEDLTNAVNELLGYFYRVEQQVQAMNGQPTVTQVIKPNIDNGHLEVRVSPPAVPESLTRRLGGAKTDVGE